MVKQAIRNLEAPHTWPMVMCAATSRVRWPSRSPRTTALPSRDNTQTKVPGVGYALTRRLDVGRERIAAAAIFKPNGNVIHAFVRLYCTI